MHGFLRLPRKAHFRDNKRQASRRLGLERARPPRLFRWPLLRQFLDGAQKNIDADGNAHAGISKYPVTVLKATEEEIKKNRAWRKGPVPFCRGLPAGDVRHRARRRAGCRHRKVERTRDTPSCRIVDGRNCKAQGVDRASQTVPVISFTELLRQDATGSLKAQRLRGIADAVRAVSPW